MAKLKVGILISGRGSNMAALIESAKASDYPAAIACVVSNVADAGGVATARAAGIETAAGSIREGESIAGPLKRSGNFPPIVTHMIAVGERSGQLEQMLENVARAYDSQVETRVQALTSLLEPLMIVIMGGGVGFIAFAILMPPIQMNEFAQ